MPFAMKSYLPRFGSILAAVVLTASAWAAEASPSGLWKWTVQGRQGGQGFEQTLTAFASAALLSLLLLALTPHPPAAVGPAVLAWATLAALAWLLPVTWLLLWGAGFLEPGRVSLLLLFEVAVAALSAALLAGEPLGPREVTGCLLILAAGALEGMAELRATRRAVAALPPGAPSTGAGPRPDWS